MGQCVNDLSTVVVSLWLQGGGHLVNLLRLINFPFVQYYENTEYLSNITFIFDSCHHSLAVVTPDKYERDWNKASDTFTK